MLHLLKEKSKVQWTAKARKKYEPLMPKLKVQQSEAFNFSSELKELNEKGADAYLGKNKLKEEVAM